MRVLFCLLAFLAFAPSVEARLPSGGACACVKAATPVASPPAATYASAQTVTLSDSTFGSSIYFTTDGTIPVYPAHGSTTLYTAPFSVGSTATVKAIAVAPGFSQSLLLTVKYTIETQVETPVISPGSGTASSFLMMIVDGTPGAAIWYTANNTTPVCASPSVQYTGTEVSITATSTVQAIACAAGFTNSAVSVPVVYTISGSPPACSPVTGVTAGTLTLKTFPTRSNGISPLLIWFDSTNTVDSGLAANTTPFNSVWYVENFGDAGASGTGFWKYGASPGSNSMDTASGAGISAHLYICPPGGGNCNYTPTVTGTDPAGNTITCQIPITAYDPSGSNGFLGTATICQSSSGTPVAGSGGCPAGAAVSLSAAMGANVGAGKQVLFKCGDTFTGSITMSGTKGTIGAYGSPNCSGTQTNRPIFNGGITLNAGGMVDWRLMDVDIESTGTTAVFENGGSVAPGPLTIYNVNSNNNTRHFYIGSAQQYGLIAVTATNTTTTNVGSYINYSGHNCINNSLDFNCGHSYTAPWSYSPAYYINNNYQAVMGSYLSNCTATPGNCTAPNNIGYETLRLANSRLGVYSNTTFADAPTSLGNAVFKMHSLNAYEEVTTFLGEFTELNDISDNLFTGASAGQLVEVAPQNNLYDERLQNIALRRNIFKPTTTFDSRLIAISGNNILLMDNMLNGAGGGVTWAVFNNRRGIEWQGCSNSGCTGSPSGAPIDTLEPEFLEEVNNTIYTAGTGIEMTNGNGGSTWGPGPNNSWVQNNLGYVSGGGMTVVGTPSGSGNVIGTSNTSNANSGNSPAFVGASASVCTTPFVCAGDYKPTANYSGALSPPAVFNPFDALGIAWSPAWDLGAVHH